MASLVLNGNTSGSVTISSPAVSGTTTLTLPTTSGTIVTTSGSQTIEFADGSASTPSITNSGDTNTGMFFPAADTIAFAEGGAESMRIDSSGNVNIGATSNDFTSKLGVTSSTAFPLSSITSAVAGAVFQKTTAGAANNIMLLTNNSFNYGVVGAVSANGTASGDVYALGYTASGNTAATQVASWTSTGLFQFNSGYGSVATAYGCRAWVNFNGTGTVAIRASGNVSSITDNGTGDYTVNFTTAMPDANYSATLGGNGSSVNDGLGRILQSFYSTGTYLSTSVRLSCLWAGDGSTREDKNIVTVAVFR